MATRRKEFREREGVTGEGETRMQGADAKRGRWGLETGRGRGRVDSMYIPDVALSDEHTGVVHRLGQTKLEDLGLEAALEEVLDLRDEMERGKGGGREEREEKGKADHVSALSRLKRHRPLVYLSRCIRRTPLQPFLQHIHPDTLSPRPARPPRRTAASPFSPHLPISPLTLRPST